MNFVVFGFFVLNLIYLFCILKTRVDPAKDVIYVNGNRLPKRQPQKVYLALNKPKGYVMYVHC